MAHSSPPRVPLATTVAIFTTAFPLDPIAEVSFVRPELEPLARRFDRVIVVPAAAGEVRCALPDGVIVDQGLAARIHPRSALARTWLATEAVRGRWLLAELWRCPRLVLFPSALQRFIFCAGAARRIGSWVEERFRSGGWDPSATMLYTYWTNYVTAGLGLARRRYPGLRVASRAHGTDIYENRFNPPCFPLQPFAIAAANRVFAASEAGRDELVRRYPAHRGTISVAPLGTPDPGFLSRPSADGSWRVVSCSSLSPVKRLELLVGALAALGARCPGRVFEWHHLGGGSGQVEIARLARKRLPANVRWVLWGAVPHERVIAFYRDNPVDLFLSTSASEGRPVSIMEAMSCGVPVAATAVGGVPELVGPDRGWLLPASASAEDIAAVLEPVVVRDSLASYRAAARRFWERELRAERNADDFASALRSMIGPGMAPARL